MLPTMAGGGVSEDDLKAWAAFGGTVEEPGKAKKSTTKAKEGKVVFVTPTGEKLKTWAEAQKLLTATGKDSAKLEVHADPPADTAAAAADAPTASKKRPQKASGTTVAQDAPAQPTGSKKARVGSGDATTTAKDTEAGEAAKPAEQGTTAQGEEAAADTAPAAAPKSKAGKASSKGTAAAAAAVPKGKSKGKRAAEEVEQPPATATDATDTPAAGAAAAAASGSKPAAKKAKATSAGTTAKTGDASIDPEATAGGKKKKKAEKNKEKKEEDAANEAAGDAEDVAMEDVVDKEEEEQEEEEGADKKEVAVDGRRKATLGHKVYREESAWARVGLQTLSVKEEPQVATEALALEQTEPTANNQPPAVATSKKPAGGASKTPELPTRRLLDFSLLDSSGDPVSVERAVLLPAGEAKLTGAVYPLVVAGAHKTKDNKGAGKAAPTNPKAEGRRVTEPFGPVVGWRVVYDKTGYKVLVRTDAAWYELSKPNTHYRKTHTMMEEQMELCHQVYLSLCPEVGGNMNTTMEEVVARLSRQAPKVGKAYGGCREALLVNSRFILNQLTAMSSTDPRGKGADYRTTVFGKTLEKEAADHDVGKAATNHNGTIRIATDPTATTTASPATATGNRREDALAAADAEYAARLQAKLNAQEAQAWANGGVKGRGGGGGAGAAGGRGSAADAYIRISEEEIAEDYPFPKQYNKEVEETDELVLTDPDDMFGVPPEDLPRNLLYDFAFYNSEGFMTTLELIPMFNGVDHDMDVFGSGVVAEDQGDFALGAVSTAVSAAPAAVAEGAAEGGAGGSGSGAGGSGSGAGGSGSSAGGSGGSAGGSIGGSGAGGSSSAAAADVSAAGATTAVTTVAPPAGGMRVFLSQVREWCVEYAADMLSISIRTDVAWYKLISPQDKYEPWYATVVKAAQVAVVLLTMLSEESRASRLSFADCVRRLTYLPDNHPGFVSKKADSVERFLVVHGQIVLNQFKHYPNKAVQRSAFVSELRQRMELRKHCKLFMKKVIKGKAAASAAATTRAPRAHNPMRNRAATGLKAKPMPATATAMVKTVWRSYFFPHGEKEEDDAAEAAAPAVAKEVEEPDADEEEQLEETAVETALAESPAARDKGKKDKKPGSGETDKTEEGGEKPAAKKDKPAKKTKAVTWGSERLFGGEADSAGRTRYQSVTLGEGVTVRVGSVVMMTPPDEEEEEEQQNNQGACVGRPRGPVGVVVCLFTDKKGGKTRDMMQVRRLLHGCDTVLGDVAGDWELFVTEDTEELPVTDVETVLTASRLARPWDRALRVKHFEEDQDLRSRNEAALSSGQPPEYFYRHLYRPQHGMFCALPPEMTEISGAYVEAPAPPVALGLIWEGEKGDKKQIVGFIKEGVEYRVGEVMYLHPEAFDGAAAGGKKKAAATRKTPAQGDKRKKPTKKRSTNEEEGDESSSSAESEDGGSESEKSEGAESDGSEEEVMPQKKVRKGEDGGRATAGNGAETDKETTTTKMGAKKDGKAAAKKRAAGKKKSEKVVDEKSEKAVEEDQDAAEEEADGDGEGKKSEKKEGPQVPEYLKGARHKGGSNQGLKAFALGQLVLVQGTAEGKTTDLPSRLVVRRLYRPEDVSKDLAYEANWWDVYAGPLPNTTNTPAGCEVDVGMVVSKAAAKLPTAKGKVGDVGTKVNTFEVVGTYDPAQPGVTGPVPTDLSVTQPPPASAKGASSKKAAKPTGPLTNTLTLAVSETAKGAVSDDSESDEDTSDSEDEETGQETDRNRHPKSAVALKSLDIFAGCGGLSEGMHQAGVAVSQWAIEYEPVAAEAFKLNYPDCQVFANNCNVLLMAAMRKAGLESDCDACDDCREAVEKLDAETVEKLPSPGEVEFIMGGPPCQGYSGMNRFNKGNWSMVQNSMVMAYLSYADFYRPRYFLLENVRNFVSHNKSFTFRLTIRSLIEMGYQVRFGVLNAGNFGVPQSRKRTLIWAAGPEETLPDWPKPRHVFHSPQLTINLPGGVAYTAVPNAPGGGAPLRAVTVRDAIMDLPPIENGHSQEEAQYVTPPASAFQRAVRRGAAVLRDHICKEMNELNLERCRCIPKGKPGADWRELQEIVKNDPSREKFNGQPLVPWCLPNTADRHNGWRGLFSRLDPNGHFPTSTTDPQPMGKVGQVFHPTQDRIVSVRECARSQGFPDSHKFAGNVHSKHRQVGNAVPPPLAHALGSQLRVVLERKRKEDIRAILDAQRRR